MTNTTPTTPPTPEPLWVLPSLYILSLGLFVPGILRAASPVTVTPPPAPPADR